MDPYPLPAFHFTVSEFGSSTSANQADIDASFREISGLKIEQAFEEVVEGGENRFVHRLPKATSQGNLVLERGLINTYSGLATWFSDAFSSNFAVPIETKNLQVQLLDESQNPVYAWSVHGCYPAKWQVDPLNAVDNKIAIEKLELAFTYLDRQRAFGPARR